MEFETKTGPQGHLYIPKKIRRTLGEHIKILPNATAVILFPTNASYKDVLNSLRIIEADLRHRLKLNEQKESDKNE